MIRILIFSIAYEPHIGGAELAVRNITDRLFDYEFDLITCRFSRAHKKFERIGNVNVYRVGFGGRVGRLVYPILAFRFAKKLHRTGNYQIVWSIMAAYAGAAGLLFVKRFPTVKFLLTLQEGDSREHIYAQVRGFKKQWQAIFRRADYIQAISNFLADWAREEGARCPVEVVPNGVDIENFSPPSPPPHEGGKERGSQFTIITVSRLVPKNGVDVLLKAAAELEIRLPSSSPAIGFASRQPCKRERCGRAGEWQAADFRLQILGSGPEEVKLKRLASELNITNRVEFLGNVSQENLPKYLAIADIFVRPSRSEGLGTAFLEAMAAGLPVIATRVGGIPDFLHPRPTSPLKPTPKPSTLLGDPGKPTPKSSTLLGDPGKEEEVPLPRGEGQGEGEANGLFANVDDPQDLAKKIRFLMQNSQLRKQLGENGQRLVEKKYNWDHIALQMKKIFETLK